MISYTEDDMRTLFRARLREERYVLWEEYQGGLSDGSDITTDVILKFVERDRRLTEAYEWLGSSRV